MSTKNVALDTRVYQKLVQIKQESESFSKAIDRILNQNQKAHTGKDVLSRLSEVRALRETEARSVLKLIRKARDEETWQEHDLR